MTRTSAKKSTAKSTAPIVVRKIRRVPAPHNSGSWKIAYADFITALMAFFLLMWMVGNNTESRLRGIAEFFETPLSISTLFGSHKSIERSPFSNGGSNSPLDGNQEVKRGDQSAVQHTARQRALTAAEQTALLQLKQQLESRIASNPTLHRFQNQLLLDITSEGLRIQIIDQQNRPMFDLGSAMLQPYTITILREIGNLLNGVPNRIGLSGHTDAARYAGDNPDYSNWELSLDRANAARRELVMGGMQDGKVLRVAGLAAASLFNPRDPYDPANRRISLIVMNTETAAAVDAAKAGTE